MSAVTECDLSPSGRAALAYAARGWSVFPVKPVAGDPKAEPGTPEHKAYKTSKAPWGFSREVPLAALNLIRADPTPAKPQVLKGKDVATTHLEIIRDWWSRAPEARVGCSLHLSGLIAVDLDDYKPDDAQRDGRPPLPAGLPETLTSRTPSGGTHRLYVAPTNARTVNFRDGEVISHGYIVLPSPDSGYEWVDPAAEVAELPDDSTAALFGPGAGRPAKAGNVPPPGDDDLAEREAELRGWLDQAGLGDYRVKLGTGGQVMAELECCPFDPADHSAPWKAVVGRASNGGWFAKCVVAGCGSGDGPNRWEEIANRSRCAAPALAVRAFDVQVERESGWDSLGQFFGGWASKRALGIDEEGNILVLEDSLEALDALLMGAPESDGAFPVDCLPEAAQPFVREAALALSCPVDYLGATVLVALAAAIGGGVEVEVKAGWVERAILWVGVVGPIGAAKSPAVRTVLAPVQRAQTKLVKENRAREKAAREESADTKEKLPPVRRDHIKVDDATLEALARILEENLHGLLQHTDELAGWVKGMGQYKAGGGRDRQQWLSFWDGGALSMNRAGSNGVGARDIYIEKPVVNVVGTIQPSVLSEVFRAGEDGLAERLLLAHGSPIPSRLNEATVSPKAEAAWDALWNRLYDPEWRSREPLRVHLTHEAFQAFIGWQNALVEEVPAGLGAVVSKLPKQVARIALVLSQARQYGGGVSLDDMGQAIQLGNYFLGQARMIRNDRDAEMTPDERRLSTRVQDLVRFVKDKGGTVGRRGVLRTGPKSLRLAEALDATLKEAVAQGVLADRGKRITLQA